MSTTLSTTNYKVILATSDFLSGGTWSQTFTGNSALNDSIISYDPSDGALLAYMQRLVNNTSALEISRPDACNRSYNHVFLCSRRDIILFTNGSTSPNISVLDLNSCNIAIDWASSPLWICASCDQSILIRNVSTGLNPWTFTLGSDATDIPPKVLKVEQCYSEPKIPPCKVTFSVNTLNIVIVRNAAKTLTLCLALFLPGFTPLITVGNAINSVSSPDPNT